MWTLDSGIELARLVEAAISPCGAHVCIGGSCLITGRSEKDLDLFIYPHSTNQKPSVDDLWVELDRIGVAKVQERPHTQYGDDKLVWQHEFQGKRVDIFYLMMETKQYLCPA